MPDIGSKSWLKAGVVVAVGLVLLVAAILFIRKPALEIDLPGVRAMSPPVRIPPFSLVDQRGKVFNNDSLTGNWTLAMVGYTFCPDICPTTLSDMTAFFKQLKDSSGEIKEPRFVFFSVDPFRDTPERLEKYLMYFHPDFIGVTGDPGTIRKMTTGLGLHYIFANPDDNDFIEDVLQKPAMDDYLVVHSTGLLFITPQGELVATMTPPFESKNVLALLQKLRTYYGE